jgi:prepilin-type N-terminal cleavage/methylation domain-containing protein
MLINSSRRTLSPGFTLIELLVVIAIIAILAGILFPVFAQAKLAAKKTSALSETKEIGLGVLIYSNDSDDIFPKSDYDFNWSAWPLQPWTSDGVVGVYVKNADIWASPADTLPAPMIPDPTPTRIPHKLSFIWNSIAPKWNTPFGVTNGHGVFTYFGYAGGDYEDITASSVTYPGDTIMMVDGRKEIVGDWWGCPWSLTTEGDYCYDWWNYRSVISFDWEVYLFATATQSDGSAYTAWHKYGPGPVAIFTDGHSKVDPVGDIYQAKRWITNAP